jgi:hypothetical protein
VRTAAAAALALSVVVAAGCGGAETGRQGAGKGRTLSGLGISVELPSGWEGRILLGPTHNLPVLQAASFPLVPGDTEDGEVAQETIGSRGIYINLSDEGPSSESASQLPVELSRSDFGTPHPGPGYLGHAGRYAYRDLVAAGHRHRLVVVAGHDELDQSGIALINKLLDSVSLERYEPSPQRTSAPTGLRLEGYGMSMRLPAAWQGRILRGLLEASGAGLHVELREHGGTDAPFVTSRFPVQLVQTEFVPACPDACPEWWPHMLAGSAESAEPIRDAVETGRSFSVNGRDFVLRIASDATPPPAEALEKLNGALKTLEIERGDFYPGRVEPATFGAADGWETGTSGPAEVEPDGQQTSSWAATIPYRDGPFQFPPHRTLEKLAPDDILIVAGLSQSGPRPQSPERALRLAQAPQTGPFEGTSAEIGQYHLATRFKDEYDVSVSVFFGRANATAEQLARAQGELDRLHLPEWGPWALHG